MMSSNSTEYYVIAVGPCSECGGTGQVQNPEWTDFYKKYQEELETLHRYTPHESISRWNKMTEDFFGTLDTPPETYECYECEGTGKIERRVPLAEALAALAVREVAP
ncbi:hypothetical protein [Caldilinea sp.]|uniref:hypothetical protein n=1 Tax=Caldilinea sp. TaxID=2293560 RepID=UPI0021DB9539|nr:hypothetical protein [Caldilinea sp.]GIV73504.1 MAG: hypothetical protein KatS3mg049_2060 [Caldilinea sp.]